MDPLYTIKIAAHKFSGTLFLCRSTKHIVHYGDYSYLCGSTSIFAYRQFRSKIKSLTPYIRRIVLAEANKSHARVILKPINIEI